MADEILVKVDGVAKKFCRSLKKSLWYGLRDMASEVVGGKGSHENLRAEEFWAVNEVSFELRRGECLGLIGRNGAGKTTLLKMLNGLIKPDHGRIEMRGRIGALIALGAGFNPILTGRENIYVNGSVLGLTKREIEAKMDDIIDFAELRDFIDSPVQSYSSGMQVRLGFAVATAMEPDVLLVDEVLAVGDAGFRAKCFDRLEKLRSKLAIILVSHNRQDIARMCTRAVMFEGGRKMIDGGVASALAHYDQSFKEQGGLVYQNENVTLDHATIDPPKMKWGGDVTLRIAVTSQQAIEGVTCRVSFVDHAEACLAEWRSENHGPSFPLKKGRNELEFRMNSVMLQSGVYFCNIVLSKPGEQQFLVLALRHTTLMVEGEMKGLGAYQI